MDSQVEDEDMSMENPDYRDRIKRLICLYITYTYTPQEPPPTYLSQARYELSIKQKKDIKQNKRMLLSTLLQKKNQKRILFARPEGNHLHRNATRRRAVHCNQIASQYQPALGGNNQSEYTLNDHTPHSLSIQAETQARSQDLGTTPGKLISGRSLPQRGAQHLRQPSST